MSSSVTALSLFQGVAGFVAGANPSCLWAKAAYSLDKSPARRRAFRSNVGFNILLKGEPEFEPATFRLLANLLCPLSYSHPLPYKMRMRNENKKQRRGWTYTWGQLTAGVQPWWSWIMWNVWDDDVCLTRWTLTNRRDVLQSRKTTASMRRDNRPECVWCFMFRTNLPQCCQFREIKIWLIISVAFFFFALLVAFL